MGRLNTKVKVKAKRMTDVEAVEYPKYFRDLANKANRYSGATKKSKIGDLGVLFNRFKNNNVVSEMTVDNWREYYSSQYPSAIKNAVKEVQSKFLEIVKVGNPSTTKLTRNIRSLIAGWVDDLIINKTFNGFIAQDQILRGIARKSEQKLTKATSEQNSRGVDGYVGRTSISVKPDTYRSEDIEAKKVVYYKRSGDMLLVTNK